MHPDSVKKVLETALLVSPEPLSLNALQKLFIDPQLPTEPPSLDALRLWLGEIASAWNEKGLRLTEVADGWRFETRLELASFLQRLFPERAQRYSRATMEVLTIIAYRQPVTRADIEAIRGVTVSSNAIKQIEERGWIEVIGHRDVIGRPALFATTTKFLNDLGLSSLSQLPPLEEEQPKEEASPGFSF